MKKIIFILLLSIVISLTFSVTAFADFNEKTLEELMKIEITKESLNLRNDNGDYITTVPGGEFVNLLEEMSDENERVHIEWNDYEGTVITRGLSKDFIFVIKEEQHIYLFQNHTLLGESPIVTGTKDTDFETPSGIFSIYAKVRDTVLRGPDYESPVKYWMPYYRGYGIHDADNWRTEYGGEIYVEDGSHGCVNTPTEMAKLIYDNCGIGYLVIVK